MEAGLTIMKNNYERVCLQDLLQNIYKSQNFGLSHFRTGKVNFFLFVAIVVLSIYFRQKGSPQSKPVDAPYAETGE